LCNFALPSKPKPVRETRLPKRDFIELSGRQNALLGEHHMCYSLGLGALLSLGPKQSTNQL